MSPGASHFYEIGIEESLTESRSIWFDDLAVTRAEAGDTSVSARTIISGWLLDQPALFSILARIRDLNLTLISVNRRTHGSDV